MLTMSSKALSAGEETEETARVHRAQDGEASAPESSGAASARVPAGTSFGATASKEAGAEPFTAPPCAFREAGRVCLG